MAAVTKNYTVEGMTCGHCKAAVEEEIGGIAGVTSVEADLSTGNVTVTADDTATIDDSAVAAAVDEAGYTLKS